MKKATLAIIVESMKSVKSAHSCTIKIPRTIPATIPTEKIRSISFICYVSRKLFVCLSRGRFASPFTIILAVEAELCCRIDR
jgi:hypothetical protein